MIGDNELQLYMQINVLCNRKNMRIRRKCKSNMTWRLQLICSIQASREVNVETNLWNFSADWC